MNRIVKEPTSSQSVFIIGIFILIFLILVVFLYYNSVKDYTTLVNDILPLYNNFKKKIPTDMIPPPHGLKMTYILWIYIDNNPENSQWFSSFTGDKIIMEKGGAPDIIYLPYSNSIKVMMNVKDIRKPIVTENSNDNVYSDTAQTLEFKEKKQEIEVPDIKFQQWTQIAVMIDNRYVDIFHNSVLVKSALLENVPIFSNKEITLGRPKHNPNIFLGKIEYKPDIISLTELQALYLRDKDSFLIDGNIRKKVNMETMNIRKRQYKDIIIKDELARMEQTDPL
jgi:hypothetical protein